MTTAVLRVFGFNQASTGLGVTEIGGGVGATLEDGSDATYLSLTSNLSTGSTAYLALDTFTLGSGRLKSMFITGRGQQVDAGYDLGALYFALQLPWPLLPQWSQGRIKLPYLVMSTLKTAAQVPPEAWTQTDIDNLVLVVDKLATGGTCQLADVSVTFVYAAIPVANITYPTGTPVIGISSPTFTWSHTPGSDGGPQTQYQVKVYTAAQYGAGGFSPDSSAATWDSGVLTGSASSATTQPLATATTFRVYVRTAQTINSTSQWSAWDFEGFSTNYTPSSVQTVTPVATSANGYITVTVARNTGTAAWNTVEVERLDPDGVWRPVRGATNPTVTVTNVFVTTYTTNSLVVRDYEAANSATVSYRSRATTVAGVVGAWVTSSTVSWSHLTDVYLKDVHNPNLNMRVLIEEMPQPATSVTQGVFDVIGSKYPVVVSDVRRSAVGTIVMRTENLQDAQNFEVAVNHPAKLLQFPATHIWGSKFVALNTVQKAWYAPSIDIGYWQWQIGYVEIASPVDETNY